jgi:hypothetical protein
MSQKCQIFITNFGESQKYVSFLPPFCHKIITVFSERFILFRKVKGWDRISELLLVFTGLLEGKPLPH